MTEVHVVIEYEYDRNSYSNLQESNRHYYFSYEDAIRKLTELNKALPDYAKELAAQIETVMVN